MPELDIFSFDRTRSDVSTFSGSEQRYSPYAAAWNEFDKLSKRTRGGGPAAWILKVIELLALGIGFFSVHLVKGPKLIIFIGWIALTVLAVFNG
jgi:hypothetical protein